MTSYDSLSPEPGSVVAGYRIERLIATGGIGSVFEASDATTSARVALKLVTPSMLDDHPELGVRLEREAQAARAIDCDRVVQVLGCGRWHDRPFIVMEYVEGDTLYQRARDWVLDLRQAQAIITDVGRALEAAHATGIVHRDIKPGNIIVRGHSPPEAKVLDFGLAKVTSETATRITADGRALGSPSYMSPEQFIDAKAVDHRADVWSLAAVAYFVLTGKRPFEGRSVGAILQMLLSRRYDPVSALRRDLDPSVDTFFARAFAFRIEDRFQSAAELTAAFSALGLSARDSSQTLVTEHTPWEERVRRFEREREAQAGEDVTRTERERGREARERRATRDERGAVGATPSATRSDFPPADIAREETRSDPPPPPVERHATRSDFPPAGVSHTAVRSAPPPADAAAPTRPEPVTRVDHRPIDDEPSITTVWEPRGRSAPPPPLPLQTPSSAPPPPPQPSVVAARPPALHIPLERLPARRSDPHRTATIVLAAVAIAALVFMFVALALRLAADPPEGRDGLRGRGGRSAVASQLCEAEPR